MVTFSPESHSYWYNGTRYTGATTLISQYKQPFDTKRIAERSAQRHGGTPQDYIAKWDNIRDTACTRGTNFHNCKEEAFYDMVFILDPNTGLEVPVHNQELQFLLHPDTHYPILDTFPDGVYPEAKLWHHPTQTAGTTDYLLLEDNYFDIDDWKTNKQIKTEGYFDYELFQEQMMKGPLSHLPDCNHSHYCLQISLYAYMVEQTGRIPRKLQFTHFPPSEDGGIIEDKPIIYPVNYMKDEIEAILAPRHTYI